MWGKANVTQFAAVIGLSLASTAVEARSARPASFDRIVVGTSTGGQVKIFDGTLSEPRNPRVLPGYEGGVRVAVGDVDGDGIGDVVAGSGPGGGPQVRVFSGVDGRELRQFAVGEASFAGGTYVAAGDVNGDGFADVVVGAGEGGGPQVSVFSGRDGAQLRGFPAFEPSFAGGVRVATGDLNGDGSAEIIVAAGPGGGPSIRVFDGATGQVTAEFMAFDGSNGGNSLATGRFRGTDALYVGAAPGSGPNVRVFSLSDFSVLADFQVFDPEYVGGVNVGAGRLGGRDTFFAAMASGGTVSLRDVSGGRLTRLSAAASPFETSFQPFGADYEGGIFVAGLAGAVPEPAVWMEMILGFGLVGSAIRSRRGRVAKSV